ncbi:hypothetical protein [Hoyosella rhizosphaerae]|uniref:Uncharacterized protein n=1 Tax=Hoyosella rhizosphaerae TaxID=1755582 RepID=A0A916XKJ1_9ACTN|nr:hypothetical protein [Hoyosella rhizosphaerae]GGC77412.1 hypothetical protein GCM10011410_33420 [Hoyosella rhizosphaerae]
MSTAWSGGILGIVNNRGATEKRASSSRELFACWGNRQRPDSDDRREAYQKRGVGGLIVRVINGVDLFKGEAVRKFAQQYVDLLRLVTANPEAKLGKVVI